MLPPTSLLSPTSDTLRPSAVLTPSNILALWAVLTMWAIGLLVLGAYQVGQVVATARFVEERRELEAAMQTVQVALWRAKDVTLLADSVMAQLGRGVKHSTAQSRTSPERVAQ